MTITLTPDRRKEMPDHTVSEAARRLTRETGETVSPQVISNFFYKRYLDDEICPVVGRCRLIPEDYIPTILQVLKDRGIVVREDESQIEDNQNRQGF